jgi:phosphatidate cytidylyltransferase
LLRWRLVSAAVILAALVLLLALDWYLGDARQPGLAALALAPMFVGVALVASREMLSLLPPGHSRIRNWSVYLGAALVIVAPYGPMVLAPQSAEPPMAASAWLLLALALAVGLVLGGAMLRFRAPGGVAISVATAVFVVTYIGLLGSFLVQLRLFGDNDRGIAALVSVIVVAKMSDVGAYVTGHLLGRHKMAPLLSPGKTIEGAVGGIVFSCLASWLLFAWLIPWWTASNEAATSAVAALAFGTIVAATGMLGDLAISLLKRDAGRKDSSHLLPGLGGVLDVIDSILTAAPAGYACWALGMVG